MVSSKTQVAARKKQDERERLVKEMEDELGLSSEHPEDQPYLNSSPEDIVANLKSKKDGWTAERVMIAFIRSACAAHRKTNCLTEILFREALDKARSMDKECAATGIAEGVFWGLPSSFKDTYNILGVDSSLGCSPHCFVPTEKQEEEATLVKLFRIGGGIPFCKTNVPQTLLAFECRNPIFGTTTNPYSSERTCGGSSGGEAALIALRGSPMGWGSDIGGSLRIPAHYSGICGLKPVRGRWPVLGQRNSVQGFEGIKGMVGPMGRTVDDLIFASRSILDLAHSQVADLGFRGEMLIPLPWKEVDLPRRLKVGYWTQDHLIKTSPACVRAVDECVKKLKDAGHEVVEFQPPGSEFVNVSISQEIKVYARKYVVAEALKIFAGLTSAEGYKSLLSNIGSDPMESSMRLVTLGSKLPRWLHGLLCWVVNSLLKDHLFASIFATSRPKSVQEFWHFTARRDVYANAFRKLVWEDEKFDMLLCPVQAVPALEHGTTKLLSPLSVGTILFNVVDSTVGVLPVTHVDKNLDCHSPDYLADSEGSWILEKRVFGPGGAYDADKMHGLPVGVQVVGREWQEEKVLGMMKVLDNLVGHGR